MKQTLLSLSLSLPLLFLTALLSTREAEGGKLYPPIEAYNQQYLNVSSLHSLYLEESGNQTGVPVIFLHGGPGSSTSPDFRRFFDPSHYRIVLFDQRGAGKSLPPGELRENDTWELVRDIERIRRALKFSRFILFGGSWGSTLALAYAQTYPRRVMALVLRGIYTNRVGEAEWLFQEGASAIFPDVWEEYLAPIPVSQRGDMINAYYDAMILSDDPKVRMEAARAYHNWECKIVSLETEFQKCEDTPDDEVYQGSSIECHYFKFNLFFDQENQLLNNVDRIRDIPTIMVHGRYDIVCPLENAWALKKAWPEAELWIAPTSGHSIREPEITSLLVDAMDYFRYL